MTALVVGGLLIQFPDFGPELRDPVIFKTSFLRQGAGMTFQNFGGESGDSDVGIIFEA